MAVVVTSDVEAALGRDLTSVEEARAFRLIQFAEAQFEAAFPGFSLATGTETAEIPSPMDGELWTPKYPVTAVSAVTVDDSDVTLSHFDIKGKVQVPGGIDRSYEVNLEWPAWDTGVWEVAYSFGLDPVPLEIVAAIAGVVAATVRRYSTNPDNVQSEMLGAYQVSYGDQAVRAADTGIILPESAMMALRKWRRTRAVAARLS